MNKIILFVALLLMMLVSCKRDPIPGDAISREKYVDILVDVHIAESMYTNRNMLKMDTLKSNELYLAVLKKHKVTEEEMLTTSLYYSRNQKEYDKIYADVLSKISLLIEDIGDPNEKKIDKLKLGEKGTVDKELEEKEPVEK